MAIKNDSKPYILEKPAEIAQEYGGNKQKIAAAAQRGIIDPTAAVLAGMFIDQMRTAAAQEQVPNQTVAQQVFAPPAPQTPPAGLGATAPAQQMAMAAPPMQPPATPLAQPPAPMPAPGMADGGLASLPVPDSLYDDSYAGGGVVAFSNAGSVSDPFFGGSGTYEAPEYSEFSKYQPMFPSFGEGNRRYKLKQLGYTNEQILNMPVAQQEFILQNVQKAATTTPSITSSATAPTITPASTAATASVAPPVTPKEPAAAAKTAPSLTSILQEIQGLMPKGEAYSESEKLVRKGMEEREQNIKNAGWLRLAEAGFGMAAGTSPYALINVAKGGAEALKGYADDLKEQRKLDRDDRKILSDIEQARRAEKRGDITAAVGSYEKALDRMSAEDRTRMTVSAYKQPAASVQEYNLWVMQQPPGADKSFTRFKREMSEAVSEGKDPMFDVLRRNLSGAKGPVKLSAEDTALIQKYLR